MALENLVILGVFLPEGILLNAVMGQKLLDFHFRTIPSTGSFYGAANPSVANTLLTLSNHVRE
jgi:hypothetical protein